MMFATDSHDVWIALFATITVGFGVLNTWLQQRNKNVTVEKSDQLSKAIAENTAITQAAHDMVKEVARS